MCFNSALLLGGNGGVVFAERYISSSLAALLVATEPFWIVLLGWLWLKGTRPNLKVALGLVIGFLDVWLIAGESFTTQMLIGAGIMVGLVGLITSNKKEESEILEIETSHFQIK